MVRRFTPARNRSCRFIFSACLIILLIIVNITAIQCEDEHSEKITIVLKEEMAEVGQRDEKIPIIVVLEEHPERREQAIKVICEDRDSGIQALKAQALETQKPLVETLTESGESENVKQLWIANSIALKATPELIQRLSERDDVRLIEPDYSVHIMSPTEIQSANTWGINKINASAVWNLGINGSGITVAVVDTGVDASHTDLDDLDDNSSTSDPKVIDWKDYVNGVETAYDDDGHGTHVSGTISGTGAGGTQTGVAPGTRLLAAKAFDSTGAGYVSDSLDAFGWAVENGADIISYSAGGGNCSNSGVAWENTINNSISAGVTVIAAAGNDGPWSNTISCPACLNKTVAVGATDSEDNIADFSSRGPVIYNGSTYTKPDVSAPGVSVTSTIVGGGYGLNSGTSMATPHVSGTVALMLQANKSLTPQEIKEILETAVDLGTPGKDNTYGSGRIDAYAAVVLAARVVIANYTITPTPTNTDPFINATATSSTNITYAEYYITTDPGKHNATPINATDGSFDDETIENLSAAINITALTDGVYQVFMRAQNNIGIWSDTCQENLSIDTTPPIVGINSLGYPDGQSASKSGDKIVFNISATDNFSGVRNASVNASQINSSLESVVLDNVSGFWINSSVVVNASDGTYHLNVTVCDNAGNLNETEQVSVSVDNTPPSVVNVSVHPDIPQINEAVNITASISDNICLNTSNLSVSIEYPDGFTNTSIMINSSKIYYYNFTNTSVYGRYNVTITASDYAGNTNSSTTWFIAARSYASSVSIEDAPAEVNASDAVDVRLEVLTNQNVSGTIEIKKMADLTPAMNRSLFLTPLEKYISINTSDNIKHNLSWIKLKFYYTQAELDASGLDENTLKISWYNESLDQWETLAADSPEWVHETGIEPSDINGYAGYIWANISHLSTFAIIGNPPTNNNNENNGGGRRSSGSSGSSGGGGGGASGEAFDNIVVKEKYYDHIYKDRTTHYNFTAAGNPISTVSITGKINAGEILVMVEALNNTSTLVREPPGGLVYRNVNIWVGTSGFATPRNIKTATIRFKVENGWLKDNKINLNKIILQQYVNNSWKEVLTQKIVEKEDYTVYESTTNHFSPFAIAAHPAIKPSLQREETAGQNTMGAIPIRPTKTEEQRATPATEETKTPGLTTAALITAILGAYSVRRWLMQLI